MTPTNRRRLLQGAGASAVLAGFPTIARAGTARVIVIGGGFGGATAAKYLRLLDPSLEVTLIEREQRYVTCPESNHVLAGLKSMADITVAYDRLQSVYGVKLLRSEVLAVDGMRQLVRLQDGTTLGYDRAIIAPGVEMRFDVLEGYDAAAAERMPHAWKAGPQTLLLRRQLEAMPDGGVVIIAPPLNPSRCPPGPYERASLIAHYLKSSKPRSKILIYDAKDSYPHQAIFEAAWDTHYPGIIEWYGASSGGRITMVDARAMTVTTEFGAQKGDVINIVPPQRTPAVTRESGIVDPWGWCPVDPRTLESTQTRWIHVVGDAANGVVMAKSATSANSQAKVCAAAIVAMLAGKSPDAPSFAGTCYSTIAPDDAVSVTDIYRVERQRIIEMLGPRGYSAPDETPALRQAEAQAARAWYAGIVADSFG